MCYAVLDGISSAYPPVMGRLHTCYSPVRRSPAGISKLTPPLPLDLHVLRLSLAFILSQDQTLRCWYLLFSFFLCKETQEWAKKRIRHQKKSGCPYLAKSVSTNLSYRSKKFTGLMSHFSLLYYLSKNANMSMSFALAVMFSAKAMQSYNNFTNRQNFFTSFLQRRQ